MASTLKIYPDTTAHQYWRGTGFTSDSPYNRSYAGATSYVYRWPLPFDVVAAFAALGKSMSGIIINSAKFHCKLDAASNSFSAGEYLGAAISTGSCYTSVDACKLTTDGGQAIDLGNAHLPAGGIASTVWDEWDMIDGEDQLRDVGGCYVVLYGNEYAVCYNNYGTVGAADRPYLEIEYDEGTIGYQHSDGNIHRAQVIYKNSGVLHLCQPLYKHSDGNLHLISI